MHEYFYTTRVILTCKLIITVYDLRIIINRYRRHVCVINQIETRMQCVMRRISEAGNNNINYFSQCSKSLHHPLYREISFAFSRGYRVVRINPIAFPFIVTDNCDPRNNPRHECGTT